MVLFTNMQSVERILYAIFYRFNQHGCGLCLFTLNPEGQLAQVLSMRGQHSLQKKIALGESYL